MKIPFLLSLLLGSYASLLAMKQHTLDATIETISQAIEQAYKRSWNSLEKADYHQMFNIVISHAALSDKLIINNEFMETLSKKKF